MSQPTVFVRTVRRRLRDVAQPKGPLSKANVPENGDDKIAVVGAGVAGATCARSLSDLGFTVDVHEKSRGAGGRCSTRRREDDRDRSLHFDHGAQYFTANNTDFTKLVKKGQNEEWIAEWKPRIGVFENGTLSEKKPSTKRYVGVPKMSSLVGNILGDLSPSFSSKVQSLRRSNKGWQLHLDDRTVGPYRTVVLTCPAPQSQRLLASAGSPLADQVADVTMTPVWSTMVSFPERLDVQYDAIFLNEGPLDWAARNSNKPGRPETDCWVLHATPDWSRQNIDESARSIVEATVTELLTLIGCEGREPDHRDAHRWRYARAKVERDEGHLSSDDGSLVVCGDWLGESRIEGAYESGLCAAGKVLETRFQR